MSDKAQNYENHARYFPPFHYIAFPILAVNVIVAAVVLVRSPTASTAWELLVAIALVTGIVGARVMSLTTQDRIIRVEERARILEQVPGATRETTERFTVDQLIGLRFASDEELPELAKRVLDGELTDRKGVKKAVKDWRADHLRV